MYDISFLQGTGILVLVFSLYWCWAKVMIRVWRRGLNNYLDKHPDVEQQLFLQHGKVRNNDQRWDNVRVDANGRTLESTGEWLNRIGIK